MTIRTLSGVMNVICQRPANVLVNKNQYIILSLIHISVTSDDLLIQLIWISI